MLDGLEFISNDGNSWVDLNSTRSTEGLIRTSFTGFLFACFIGVGPRTFLVGIIRNLLLHIGNYKFNVEMMSLCTLA